MPVASVAKTLLTIAILLAAEVMCPYISVVKLGIVTVASIGSSFVPYVAATTPLVSWFIVTTPLVSSVFDSASPPITDVTPTSIVPKVLPSNVVSFKVAIPFNVVDSNNLPPSGNILKYLPCVNKYPSSVNTIELYTDPFNDLAVTS